MSSFALHAACVTVACALHVTGPVSASSRPYLSFMQVQTAARPAIQVRNAEGRLDLSCIGDVHFFGQDDCDMYESLDICAQRRKEITWLASFPGSGNTWTRELLEQTTGIYTGSMYDDESLIEDDMLGEGVVDPGKVTVVKTHAHEYSQLAEPGARAIVLLRSPLDAVLSRMQIRAADVLGLNMHNSEIPYDDLRKRFDKRRDTGLEEWKEHLSFWSDFFGEHIIVRYEDLTTDPRGTMEKQILPFLGINVSRVQTNLGCATGENTSTILRNHSYTFKFTEGDRAAAARILGDLGERFGYYV